jgi:hypothetical protein
MDPPHSFGFIRERETETEWARPLGRDRAL